MRVRNRELPTTLEVAAHVRRGLPIHQTSTLHQRGLGTFWTRHSQSYRLEGPVAIANYTQQGMGINGVGIANDCDLTRLR
jgi:hypothetical protein